MKKKIIFRADASEQIGYGHFVRSLALAEMMKDDFDVTFFTEQPTEEQRKQVNAICPLVELSVGDAKFDQFLNCLQGNEIVFLDNYFFSSDYQLQIKKRGSKLICLGTNDRHYYCDVLLNFAESDASIFSVEPYTQIKLGIDWAILRKPFHEMQPIRPKQRQNRIAICYGGTDQYHLTEKTVKIIQTLPEHIAITLIATDRFGEERFASLREQGVNCLVNATAEQMIETFSKCDFLISSASTIAHEGLACQLPVVCGYYVENQRRMYEYLTKENLVIGLSNMLSGAFTTQLSEILMNREQYFTNIRPYQHGDIKQKYLTLFKNL